MNQGTFSTWMKQHTVFKVLPNKTYALKNESCSSRKKLKERSTVMLCVNAVGEFEKPLVIGKAKRPHCFKKNIDMNRLGVMWASNKKKKHG